MAAAVPESPGTPAQFCAEHRDRASVATCPRCGRFVCEECWGEHSLCLPCLLAVTGALPRLEPRTRWAARFFILNAATLTAAMASNVLALSGAPEMGWAVDAARVLPTVIGTVGAVIAFLVWLHLLARYLQALRLEVEITPAWSVAWWFIPVANLLMPYLVVRSFLKTLGGAALNRASAAAWWWVTWLSGTWLMYAGKVVTGLWFRQIVTGPGFLPEDLPAIKEQMKVALTEWEIFSCCALIVSAVLAVRLVRSAQRALDARVAGLDVRARAPVSAPAA